MFTIRKLGIKVDTEVKGNKGIVRVKAFTNVGASKQDEFVVLVRLLDADGNVVGEAEGRPAENAKFVAKIEVENAHLWHGIKDPYLYTVQTYLMRDDMAVDKVCCKCGIRTFKFDPDKGFFLNGMSYPLRGVARHQDFKGIGNAISQEIMERDMELIREIGANSVRLAHYQHSQYFYDLCDKY